MRTSGVLLHISSLPSPYGIGTLGKEAYEFVDFLAGAGQKVWQILPIGPTGYGDCPYQSYSTFAGNPYFIDLTLLAEEGLLEKSFLDSFSWGEDSSNVDYGLLWENRFTVLRRAYEKAIAADRPLMEAFTAEESYWLEAYALYMAVKTRQGYKPLSEWPEEIRRREPEAMNELYLLLLDDLEFWRWIQYRFWNQWRSLKEYANSKDIRIIGDLPFYVALDSADVWAHPDIFELDGSITPLRVSGCPPDYFNGKGQLWGNPLYNWEILRERSYDWWIARIKSSFQSFDLVRIDHFRGFEAYYAIPAGRSDAREGCWVAGPGMDFFSALIQKFENPPIIAEDLGFITDDTRRLLAETNFPGMKVLQFAFDPHDDSDYLPHNHIPNCAAYIGTHDNDTLAGWLEGADSTVLAYARRYLRIAPEEDEVYAWIQSLLMSPANQVILTMQDLLCLPSSARMNIPSTQLGNWRWRLRLGDADTCLARRLRDLTSLYRRL